MGLKDYLSVAISRLQFSIPEEALFWHTGQLWPYLHVQNHGALHWSSYTLVDPLYPDICNGVSDHEHAAQQPLHYAAAQEPAVRTTLG
jgi:hypothetical protein